MWPGQRLPGSNRDNILILTSTSLDHSGSPGVGLPHIESEEQAKQTRVCAPPDICGIGACRHSCEEHAGSRLETPWRLVETDGEIRWDKLERSESRGLFDVWHMELICHWVLALEPRQRDCHVPITSGLTMTRWDVFLPASDYWLLATNCGAGSSEASGGYPRGWLAWPCGRVREAPRPISASAP